MYAGLLSAKVGTSPMSLMTQIAVPCCEEITCHPEGQGIEEVHGEGFMVHGELVLMHFGNYELVIIDGRKQIRKK